MLASYQAQAFGFSKLTRNSVQDGVSRVGVSTSSRGSTPSLLRLGLISIGIGIWRDCVLVCRSSSLFRICARQSLLRAILPTVLQIAPREHNCLIHFRSRWTHLARRLYLLLRITSDTQSPVISRPYLSSQHHYRLLRWLEVLLRSSIGNYRKF